MSEHEPETEPGSNSTETSPLARVPWWAWIALGIVLVVVVFSFRGEDKPGLQSVYDEIDATTSCTELQSKFDTAMTNVERYPGGDSRRDIPLAYAEYTQARMDELGC